MNELNSKDFFYDLSSVPKKEILRYLKVFGSYDSSLDDLINECLQELLKIASPKIVFKEFDLTSIDDLTVEFLDVRIQSTSLCRNLKNCSRLCLFVATIGTEVDTLLRKNSVSGVSKVAIMQAIGATLIEEFCNQWNKKYSVQKLTEGFLTHVRFSPGYGDLLIQHQKDFFRLLDCTKIGVSLTDSMLMVPSKTVSAIIGLEKIKRN